MSRLASFKGPSTPTSSPVQAKSHRPQHSAAASGPGSPRSASKPVESTYHRKLRTLLYDLRNACETWDQLVLVDGLKAAKGLVDTRTELDNALSLLPADQLPRTRMVGPKLAIMDQRISELDAVIEKLRKQFRKMCATVDSMESLLAEAHKAKGWDWVSREPLWLTWSLERFVTCVPVILKAYDRTLNDAVKIASTLRPHSASFDDSRRAISEWAEQRWLEEEGWHARWEDLCEVEVERWD